MAFNRPTLSEIIKRAEADIDARLPSLDAKLQIAVIDAVVNGVAAVAHGLYGNLDYLSKQILPDSAEQDFLRRHAHWWGIFENEETPATGHLTVQGVNGNVVDKDAIWQRSDGAQFTVDEEVPIIGGVASVAITAVEVGQAGNTAAGVTLSVTSPLPGVTSQAVTDSNGLSGGTDIEDDDSLRDRLQDRVQRPPHGGAKYDYEKWGKDISGVTRVWSFPLWFGDGTVGVFFTRDDDANIIPDTAEVATVQDYIDTVRPVTAQATVMAPSAQSQDMIIQISPSTTVVQNAIEASLKDVFRLEAQVEDGEGSGTILISHIREAISIASGESDHVLINPTSNITLAKGQLATLGDITWQAL
ncbi:baseplate J/gp47 family protein [Methylophaga nitratireducenticrescens]|uniref:baseplate J/gp47 family protein n=1 Tax=Methylophaga nitratireducenticrescens TaxID=754476 RepID=UPI000CDCB390|nr:baseplate J/gp47 family protein [Methylophaga nitratireducenticrescens]AUZ85782.1 baseplate J protein [Methylophaga nitratireducenticrescens]AUZ85839.1 baseplate J protein [Methylophaga nitratireducenticrescens]